VVLNFWATWCDECKKEMPALEKFYQAHQGQDLVVVAVNVMQRDNKESIEKYVKNMGLTFPIGLDAARTTGQQYGVQFLPMTYLIDKQGMIAAVKVGPLSDGELESYWTKITGQ
jgi:thiol-disulfide isomerase/thioredoxin